MFDRTTLIEQLGGDEQLAREVIDLFIREGPAQLSAIKSALDAGQLQDAYVAAHTLKGAASTLAAFDIAAAAEHVEQCCKAGQLDAARESWPPLDAAMVHALPALRAALPETPDTQDR